MTDLTLALGLLRLLTILPLCPEAAVEAERRVVRALDRLADAREIHDGVS